MEIRPADEPEAGYDFVSTGRLPPSDLVSALVAEAHDRFKSDSGGENSQRLSGARPHAEHAVRHLRGRERAAASSRQEMPTTHSRS